MKKITFLSLILFFLATGLFAQKEAKVLNARDAHRCVTMEKLDEAIKKDPSLPQQWKIEGEKRYKDYLQRQSLLKSTKTEAGQIIIPIVFHLVDDSATLGWITDRDIYEQVEILNKAYNGNKGDNFQGVIPGEIYNRLGRIPVKFVLARRTPAGALTNGIERRADSTPDRISIKSYATGGLDAWDVNKYLNVWCGTFTGGDGGLLGIATFPFTTTEGPQGVDIAIATLPFTSNKPRSYYPSYSEGGTLAHEVGHYFYLWHTFGDQTICNNDDFRIQSGWPLPLGAGPEGDDTPPEKFGPGNQSYGNPSLNYSDGCANTSFGEMYGSFMNYFDDRAMFMFSDGMRKRVEGCINLYRPGLLTSNGATPPVAVTDAFLVTVNPRGIPERREYFVNNAPLTATVRNSGTSILNSVTLNVKMDGASPVSTTFPLNLLAGSDTVLNIGAITGATGTHTMTIYTSAPNNGADSFTDNDTLQSFVYIEGSNVTAPLSEKFSGNTFPPAGWQIWNPNKNTTWTNSTTSGYSIAGAATVQNFNYNGVGQLDDLISPPIDLGAADSSVLSFRVASAVYDTLDVSTWDGLEIYISTDGGLNYQLAYKKTGNYLRTIDTAQTSSFEALPSQPGRWRFENINLTPYLIPGKKVIVKFRNINGYGNNTYLDDISVSAYKLFNRDILPIAISNLPDLLCGNSPTPAVQVSTNGKDTVKSFRINYQLDNGNFSIINWTGVLTKGQSTNVQLSTLNGLTQGNHLLTIITSDPNGLNDELPANDTIRKSFYVFGKVNLPLTEGFEGVAFPPPTWGISNSDGGITWERTTNVAKTGIGAMVIRNYDNNVSSIQKFVSSIISNTTVYDSLFVSFDYAYAQGTQASRPDTLDLQLTTDCGNTLNSIWKKWGAGLQTLADPNAATGARFTPSSGDWMNARIDISQMAGTDFQVSFTSRGNSQNNLYIDNINIYGVIVPARLKKQGYLIYPNPFSNQFIIRNYEVPFTFQSASVYNSVGQLVWTKNYNGNAFKEETVDLSNLARGIYIVKLKYTDKTVVERIVKD